MGWAVLLIWSLGSHEGMKQSWKRNWGGEREEVREKSIRLLVCLFFLRNGRRVKRPVFQWELL